MSVRVAYVIGTYPVLTTTFIDREIAALRRLGVDIRVVSIRRPADPGEVIYLLPARHLLRSHLRWMWRTRYWSTLIFLMTRHHPWGRRLRTLGHFGVALLAVEAVAEMKADRVHAHFVDRAATVALVISRLLRIPFSVTAHANDIYVNPVMLAEKIGLADFALTCTGFNRAHLVETLGETSSLITLHHGLELDRYVPGPPERESLLLAVGQLKEKKGLTHLIEACAGLKRRGIPVRCVIVGDGPLRPVLEDLVTRLGLEESVTLVGALPHHQVIEWYARATIFALPCLTAEDGDRDGIPNVILEAMAMGLPVVSTRHSGIPEAVEDGVSGVLVPPGDTAALVEALEFLLGRPDLGRKMGEEARQLVTTRFDVVRNARILAERFENA